MSNRVFVRSFDPKTKLLTGCHYEDPDYKLKDNETFIKIPDGLRPPYKFVNDNWIGSTEEEFQKAFPVPEGMKQANQQAAEQSNAELLSKVNTLTQSLNTLGAVIAKQIAKPASTPTTADTAKEVKQNG